MRSTLIKIATLLALFVLVAFLVFVVNQTASLVRLAGEISPQLGTAVMTALLVIYAVLLLVPLVLYLRLPPPLVPPKGDHGPEFEAHLTALKRRLRGNDSSLSQAMPWDRKDRTDRSWEVGSGREEKPFSPLGVRARHVSVDALSSVAADEAATSGRSRLVEGDSFQFPLEFTCWPGL